MGLVCFGFSDWGNLFWGTEMRRIKILYVGGLNANQKGAVGSHTSGVIKALKNNDKIDLQGLFFKNCLLRFIVFIYIQTVHISYIMRYVIISYHNV